MGRFEERKNFKTKKKSAVDPANHLGQQYEYSHKISKYDAFISISKIYVL